MTAPLLHAEDIKAELDALLRTERNHFLFAFHGQSDTSRVTADGHGEFPVYSVTSELALRRELVNMGDRHARAVFLLTSREPLPLDLSGRFALGGRVRVIGKEPRLKRLLGGVPRVDPDLLKSPLVDYLLGQSHGTVLSLSAGDVTERKLWEAWLGRAWLLDTEGGLAVDTLLASIALNVKGAQFSAAMADAPAVRDALERFLEATLKAAGPLLLQAWVVGKGELALQLSVVCEALRGQSAVQPWLRLRIRQLLELGADAPIERFVEQLAEAAGTALTVYSNNVSGDKKAALRSLYERAEALINDHDVRSALAASNRLPSGFHLRLEALGQALSAAAAGPSAQTLQAVLAAKDRLTAHTSVVDEARDRDVRRAEMAVRLLAWVASDKTELEPGFAESADADVGRLGRWYVEEGGFVDWARRVARGSVQSAFDRGVEAVLSSADALREELDLRFARALPAWLAAYRPTKQVLPIDQVMARVVAPFLEERPDRKLLVILLDGMAWAQAAEIVHSLGEQADVWGPAAWHARGRSLKLGDARTPVVIAGLPTITDVSRSAFFAGKLMVSGKAHDTQQDPTRLRDNAALKKFFEGAEYPRLFLRSEGHEAHGSIAQPPLNAIADASQRVVAVVINAIDASLKGDTQQWHPWRAENVRSLLDLLAAAKRAGRSVLLAADHGHVPADRFEPGIKVAQSGGARWRPLAKKSDPAEPFEVLLHGEGVYLPKGAEAVALLADDRHRYGGAAHAGEHGGATLAEVVAPCVMIHWEDALGANSDPDRNAQGQYKPAWWSYEVRVPAAQQAPSGTVKAPSESARPKKPVAQNQLTLPEVAPPPAPVVEKSASVPSLSAASRALSELPAVKALAALHRTQLCAALDYLLERGDMSQLSALANHLGEPEWRIGGFISRVLQRTLNVDGFQVITYDQTHVRLEREVLVQQFGVKL